MATYKKKQATVEAVQFTRDLAEVVQAFQADAANQGKTHPSGITYEEGRGYRARGFTLSFGDYLVTSRGTQTVQSAKDFEADYEVA